MNVSCINDTIKSTLFYVREDLNQLPLQKLVMVVALAIFTFFVAAINLYGMYSYYKACSLNNEGYKLQKEGKYEEAIKEYNKIFKFSYKRRNTWEAWANIGALLVRNSQALVKNGKLDEAKKELENGEKVFKKLLDIAAQSKEDPEMFALLEAEWYFPTVVGYATVLSLQEKYEEAAAQYEKVLKYYDDDQWVKALAAYGKGLNHYYQTLKLGNGLDEANEQLAKVKEEFKVFVGSKTEDSSRFFKIGSFDHDKAFDKGLLITTRYGLSQGLFGRKRTFDIL